MSESASQHTSNILPAGGSPRLGRNTLRAARVAITCALSLSLGVLASGCSLFGGGSVGGDAGAIRRIAIIPFAYRDGASIYPCTLCPDRVVMADTSRDDALLVTAFFHEALTTYPRFSILPYDRVERFATDDMDETRERLFAVEGIDAVLVGALMELRARTGDPREPEAKGGAAVYAALVDASTGQALWSAYRDEDQLPPSLTARRMADIVSGEPIRWLSSLGLAQVHAEELVSELASKIQ